MVTIRPLSSNDRDVVQWTLYGAVTWNDPPGVPPLEIAVEHPQMKIYHEAWGRPGDFGVVAYDEEVMVGAAFGRLFTDRDHGHGYVDSDTPELGIAVAEGYRGKGIGRSLMEALADEARAHGMDRMSLSVNNPNPAKHLYDSLGYVAVDDDGSSTTMVIEL